jgi:hypothetical protein
VRTLVVGIPLPNPRFDNHSFLSAPSFSEYSRIVVEMSAVSAVIDEVIEGTSTQSTYGGQAIVNGPASSHAFPLADLLEMRRRETRRLLDGGGLVVLIGHPQVVHQAVGGGLWASYSWLPPLEGFSYGDDILAGFGTPGAVLADAAHPFAPYVEALASRISYRVYVNEDASAFREHGRVFARGQAGVAIGFELKASEGRLVFLPAITKPQPDRQMIADAIVRCLEQWDDGKGPAAISAQPEFKEVT